MRERWIRTEKITMVSYPGEKVLFAPPIMINLIIGNLFRNGTRTSEVLALTGLRTSVR